MTKKILVIDDDHQICELIRIVLEKSAFVVDVAYDGVTGLEKAVGPGYDLVVLDIMLPGKDGWDVCRGIRNSKARSIPIIMLTAKGEEIDKILGLELGADDYITKPFSPREFLARVKALLRRSEEYNVDSGFIKAGNLVVETQKYEAAIGDHNLELTPKEFNLLVFLAAQKGRAFSREQLLEQVWGFDYPGKSNRTVDEHVKRLRGKIAEHDQEYTYLQTVWGVGYKFEVKKHEAAF